MAKEKYTKKSTEAEQQTTSGVLQPENPTGLRSSFSPGDWIVYEPDGTRFTMTDAEFQARYEKA